MRASRNAAAALLLTVGLCAACDDPEQCDPGSEQDCTCADGGRGSQACAANGSWAGCVCGSAARDAGGEDTAAFDAGPIPDGARGAPCPAEGCHPALTAVATGDGCVCYGSCDPSADVPRCIGWEVCAQLRLPLDDGGSNLSEAGVCLPAGGPDEPCPCGETLICARLSQEVDNTCHYSCVPSADAAIADATGADMVPAPGSCPPGQSCFGLGGSLGACFHPQ